MRANISDISKSLNLPPQWYIYHFMLFEKFTKISNRWFLLLDFDIMVATYLMQMSFKHNSGNSTCSP